MVAVENALPETYYTEAKLEEDIEEVSLWDKVKKVDQ